MGGGTRTPVFGFGDRQIRRYLTPMRILARRNGFEPLSLRSDRSILPVRRSPNRWFRPEDSNLDQVLQRHPSYPVRRGRNVRVVQLSKSNKKAAFLGAAFKNPGLVS
jgi:hypothetical protein